MGQQADPRIRVVSSEGHGEVGAAVQDARHHLRAHIAVSIQEGGEVLAGDRGGEGERGRWRGCGGLLVLCGARCRVQGVWR